MKSLEDAFKVIGDLGWRLNAETPLSVSEDVFMEAFKRYMRGWHSMSNTNNMNKFRVFDCIVRKGPRMRDCVNIV